MISGNETQLIGSWQMVDGKLVEDAVCHRIRFLVETVLKPLAVSQDGWEKLYADPQDGRLWEFFYPDSELHGGGPPALRVIDKRAAGEKYNVTVGERIQL